MHDPVSYVSRYLADRLGVPPTIQGFETRRVRAALLLTDVVDFSAHVDRVSAAGAPALEQLAHDFDGYLSELVRIVDQWGGDVLSIAGDRCSPTGRPGTTRTSPEPSGTLSTRAPRSSPRSPGRGSKPARVWARARSTSRSPAASAAGGR